MKRTTAIAGLVFVGLIVLMSSALFVDETESVIITQFGKPQRTVSDPGLHWKIPFVQTALRIEKRILASDARHEEYLTSDKKRLVADPITRWRVVEPLKYYERVRDEMRARQRLDDLVRSELRQELASHTMGEMVGGARDAMMAKVTERVAAKATEYGIKVVDVRIKRLDLPKEVQQSVFARMEEERKRLAKKYRAQGQEASDAITSETDREQTIILAKASAKAERLRGDGDATSTQVYADAYNKAPEFYAFTRTLEAYERSVDGKSTLVLSTGSDLFRYLTKPGRAPKEAGQ